MLFSRLLLGLRCLFSILQSGNLSLALRHELDLVRVTAGPPGEEDHGPIAASEERVRGAVQILRVLQSESGLIDFLTEDLRFYSDHQLAQGIRAMQPSARACLEGAISLSPIVDRAEGEMQDLPADPAVQLASGSLRLEGRPYDFEAVHGGILRHRGWRVSEVKLLTPPHTMDPTVIHPAVYEIE